jgi:glycosyltransferase involved in cell wall biosynthesis
LNTGISEARSEIVAFLDEDVIPGREWVERLIGEFDDETLAACGGKDTIVVKGRKIRIDLVDNVGETKWKGYIVGNQHRGRNRRDVTFLKGCNMAIRRIFLKKLDERLIGLVRWEQDIFLNIRKAQKRVLYDPTIEVMHCKDSLQFLSSKATFWFAHNTVYLFLKFFKGNERIMAVLFCFFIGNASSPGLIRFIHWFLTRNDQAMCGFCASMLGKVKGLLTYLNALNSMGTEAL